MAIIKPSKGLEAATAAHLVSLGKATPEQQKLAYKHLIGLIKKPGEMSAKKAGKKPAKKAMPENERAAMIEILLRDALTEDPKATIREICQFVLDDENMREAVLGGRTIELRTIETGYQHWKSNCEYSKQLDIDRVIGPIFDAFAAAFDTAQPQKMKVGKK